MEIVLERPDVLILDDGQLEDVRELVDELGVPFTCVLGEDLASVELETPKKLLVATTRHALALKCRSAATALQLAQGSAPAEPLRVAVLRQDEMGACEDELRERGFDYLLRRPVSPGVWRAVLQGAFSRSTDRRSAERVTLRLPVSCRVDLHERPALLVDLSLRGARLLAPQDAEPDTPISIFLPKDVTEDGTSLCLAGWVLRCTELEARMAWPFELGVVFDGLPEEEQQRLEAFLGSLTQGPTSTLGKDPNRPDTSRSGQLPAGRSSVTFGRYLVERGVLSQTQLDEVTGSMVVLGGRLGTHLVEKGLLDVEELETHLATHLGVRVAPRDRVEAPNPVALGRVPMLLIRRHKVLPFDVDGETLQVAMRDPRDARAREEIQRATGLRIEPYLLAEVQLFRQLERRFGLDRSFCYAGRRAHPAEARKAPNQNALPLIILEDLERPETSEEEDTSALAPLRAGEELIDAQAFARLYGSDVLATDRDDDDGDRSSQPAKRADQAVAEAPSASDPENGLERARNRDEVVHDALRIGRRHASMVALFVVRDVIQGLVAAGAARQTDLRAVVVPREGKSRLVAVAETGRPWRGSPAPNGIEGHLARLLHEDPVREVALLPIQVRDRVVNVLWADNGPDPLAERSLEALSDLCARVRGTYERIIVERKTAI